MGTNVQHFDNVDNGEEAAAKDKNLWNKNLHN